MTQAEGGAVLELVGLRVVVRERIAVDGLGPGNEGGRSVCVVPALQRNDGYDRDEQKAEGRGDAPTACDPAIAKL
jgi:hypothetical protein